MDTFDVIHLDPASWYQIRIAAHNSAGSTEIEYEFSTITEHGGTIALPTSSESGYDGKGTKVHRLRFHLHRFLVVIAKIIAKLYTN